MKYYKLLDEKGTGSYNKFKWDVTGKWMSVWGELKLCKNGFHVLRKKDIVYWLKCGFNLYEVEIKGDKINSDVKVCVRSVRVIKKIENYNKDNLLKTVINPAVKRTKQYADRYTYYAAADASKAAAKAADASADADYAANAAVANTPYDYAAAEDAVANATRCASFASVATAAAANAANAANATRRATDDAGYTAERLKQTKDLGKLLK